MSCCHQWPQTTNFQTSQSSFGSFCTFPRVFPTYRHVVYSGFSNWMWFLFAGYFVLYNYSCVHTRQILPHQIIIEWQLLLYTYTLFLCTGILCMRIKVAFFCVLAFCAQIKSVLHPWSGAFEKLVYFCVEMWKTKIMSCSAFISFFDVRFCTMLLLAGHCLLYWHLELLQWFWQDFLWWDFMWTEIFCQHESRKSSF